MVRLPELAPSAFFLGHVGWSAFHRKASATRPHTHPQTARLFGHANKLGNLPNPPAVPGKLHALLCDFRHLKPQSLLWSKCRALNGSVSSISICGFQEMGLQGFDQSCREMSDPMLEITRGESRRT